MPCEQTSDWTDRISLVLIERGARDAPAPLAWRLAEEWRADLQQQQGRLARVRFAVGCCWAGRVLAAADSSEIPLAVPCMPVSRPRRAPRAPDDETFITGRAIAYVMVASLQAGLLCCVALAAGAP